MLKKNSFWSGFYVQHPSASVKFQAPRVFLKNLSSRPRNNLGIFLNPFGDVSVGSEKNGEWKFQTEL